MLLVYAFLVDSAKAKQDETACKLISVLMLLFNVNSYQHACSFLGGFFLGISDCLKVKIAC